VFKRKGKDEDDKKETSKAWFYAADIVKNPEEIDDYPHRYLVVADHSLIMRGHCFDNMPKALNLLAEQGWRIVDYEMGAATSVIIGHAILERDKP